MLALPIMGGQLGQIMVNQIDAIMIGHLGSLELAAVALSNAVFVPVLLFGFGISSAISPLVSEAVGGKNDQDVSSYLKHGLIICSIVGILIAFLFVIGAPLLYQMNQPEEVVRLAIPYIQINSLSLISLMVFHAIRQFGEGLFETKSGMFAIISGNVINVVFNFLLIYGMFGFPKLGIIGAGYGTLIARTFMPLLVLYLYFKKPHIWRFTKRIQWKRYNKVMFNKILSLGVPSAFQGLFVTIAFGAAAFIAGLIGVDALAAHQVAMNITETTYLLCMGLSIAVTIRIGNRLGEKDFLGLRKVGISSILLSIAFRVTYGVLFVILSKQLPWIYTRDAQVIEIASSLIIVSAFLQISDGLQVVLTGILRGMQDAKIPMIITFVAYWVLALPISCWLGIYMGFGTVGIWIGLLIGLTVSAFLLFWRFHLKTNAFLIESKLNSSTKVKLSTPEIRLPFKIIKIKNLFIKRHEENNLKQQCLNTCECS